MSAFKVRVHSARKTQDPVYGEQGVERYSLTIPVRDYPAGLPLDPNARVPKINRRVYRDVEASLLNQEGEPHTFHLKHKGIVVVAEDVRKDKAADDVFELILADESKQGILDGGHTDALLNKHLIEGDLPEKQFVEMRVYTRVPEHLIPELSQGLNTSVQVQAFSLDNLAGRFKPFKAALAKQSYGDRFAWREGEDGDYDARDLMSLLLCFNIDRYPNSGSQQPVAAYEKKAEALRQFEEYPDTFERLIPIMPDILQLHDLIQFDARKYWNEKGGQFGKFAFVDERKRGEFVGTFDSSRKGKYRLMDGALYPMLAAFRWMVEEDSVTGDIQWRGGFDAVLEQWSATAAELVGMTAGASQELGRNPNAIGKSRNHWSNLHARVAMRDLMAKAGVTA